MSAASTAEAGGRPKSSPPLASGLSKKVTDRGTEPPGKNQHERFRR